MKEWLSATDFTYIQSIAVYSITELQIRQDKEKQHKYINT